MKPKAIISFLYPDYGYEEVLLKFALGREPITILSSDMRFRAYPKRN